MFVYIPTRNKWDWTDLLAGIIIGGGFLIWCCIMAVAWIASAFR